MLSSVIRTHYKLGLILICATLLSSSCKKNHYADTFHPAMSAPNIVLQSADGTYDLFSQNKKLYLVFFGYTNCPDICPMTLSKMAQTLKHLDTKYQEQIQMVFISVDV